MVSGITHGNLPLEEFLRNIVMSFKPSFIPGNVYVVFNSDDETYVQYSKDWDALYPDGTKVIHTTLASAYAAVTSNRHDVILVNAHNGHAQTAMLTVAKNRMHIWGMGNRAGSIGMGARARVTMGVTTAATDLAVMKNTGVGNTFRNLKFDSANTKDESLYSVIEAGEYAIYDGCEIYKSTDLDETTAAELALNGDSAQFHNCVVGSLANTVSTAIIRPCVQLAQDIVTGKIVRDCYFDNCLFLRRAGGTANSFVDATTADDVERMLMFKDCEFIAAELGSQPAEAVTSSGGKQTDGLIMLSNCTAWNCTLLKEASVGIWVNGPSVTHNTASIAKDA